MIASLFLTVLGLSLFEVVSSIDNAVINAEVLSTMGAKARRWFLLWGFFLAVVLVRGVLPWLIVWLTVPELGPVGALTTAFSGQESVKAAVEHSAPVLLIGGGTFLVFLFFHWLFLEEKHFGLRAERFFLKQGIWFYAVVGIFLTALVKVAIGIDARLALGAVVGSTVFFILHGFRQNAEQGEEELAHGNSSMSDTSKLLYLEVIDAVFSVDGVLGAFAFTFSVPLILLGNGIGAIVVRYLTIRNVESIKKYYYIKNGAMYSILVLGVVMLLDSFGFHVPEYVSPVLTFLVVGLFFWKSVRAVKAEAAVVA